MKATSRSAGRVAADGTDTPLLYKGDTAFPLAEGKATFHPLEYVPPSEEHNKEYDLHLNNGRLLEHFEQGNMTYRVAGVKEMTPGTFLEVSPELAAERGLETGRHVLLESPYGRVRVQVLITHRVEGKQMYMPMNSIEEPVNRLTSSHLDPRYAHPGLQGSLGEDDRAPPNLATSRCLAETFVSANALQPQASKLRRSALAWIITFPARVRRTSSCRSKQRNPFRLSVSPLSVLS